jgi:KAP family P-loop domain
MPTDDRPGYDAPRRTQDQDDLDRWRFAAELVSLVVSTPLDWSIRIGVFGKWGEGKTSVLNFTERMLRDDGHLVFWFNPWAVTQWNELWAEFARKFVTALDEAGIEVKGLKAVRRRLLWLRVQQPIEQLSGLYAASKATVGATLPLVRQALQIDGPQLSAIQKRLARKRVVVIIDDLDRVDPKLVPQLLMALRELLDLPGFAFLLGFDDRIVAEALTSHHPAWTDGQDFLEKILDFRFPLPPVSAFQQRRLIQSAIPQFCPFVDSEAVNQVEDLLPANPRKLKTLVRNLAALKSEVSRHDPDELNWVDILIAQLIKMESTEFFERFLGGEVLEQETGVVHMVEQRFRTRGLVGGGLEPEGEADPNARLKEYLTEWKINDPAVRERIVKLVEALRARGGSNFRYHAEFAVRPHRITWKEFREVFAAWKGGRDPNALGNWLQQHASRRSATIHDVCFELFDAAIKFRDEQLNGASQSDSLAEHESAMAEAHSALDLLDTLVSGRVVQTGQVLKTPDNFDRLLKMSLYWIRFRTNRADAAAREEERNALMNFLRSGVDRPELYLELLKPWAWEHEYAPIDRRERELQTDLRNTLVAPLIPVVLEDALKLFEVPNGVRRLNEKNRLASFKYVLFNESPLLSERGPRRTILQIFDRAAEDNTIHGNCIDFFELVLNGLRTSLEGAPIADIRRLPHDEVFVRQLWKSVVARRIQYRMQQHILDGRQALIDSGAAEEILPVPDWLAERLADRRGEQSETAG